MTLKDRAAGALAERTLAVDAYGGISSIETLEALRDRTNDEAERKTLDLAIVLRKRSERVRFEKLAAGAEMLEKSSLPVGAAAPVFATFLAAEHFISEAIRPTAMLVAYVLGPLLWLLCRFLAYKWMKDARCGMARLGKVE